MLTNPTIDMLRELGLTGMASAYQELEAQTEARHLEHGEWLALLLEREATVRRQKRFEARACAAKLRHDAQIENIDFRAARGLDRNLLLKLAGCDRIRQRHSLLLIGPAGVGKSWLACALGHKACREDFSVAYYRLPRLCATLALARGDGRYPKVLKALARTDLLILDDWGREKRNDEQRRDLLDIIEDRYQKRSTIVTSQVPVDHWYLVRHDRQSNHSRRDPRPPRAQRLPHRNQRREHAKAAPNTIRANADGLTSKQSGSIHRYDPGFRPIPVRLRVGIVAEMKSEWVAGFVSESAADFTGIRTFVPEATAGGSGKHFQVFNPSTGELLAERTDLKCRCRRRRNRQGLLCEGTMGGAYRARTLCHAVEMASTDAGAQ